MTRHEMAAKRKVLSHGKRWLVSVWNRGRMYRDEQTRDGDSPPWLIFFDDRKYELASETDFRTAGDTTIQIGILDVSLPKPVISPRAS